ncbi:hypothetical protein ACFV27_46035 [Streptomyces antimycoticus]|uniref:Uncharacterized protein n=3 Tax=Streptomyces TaxID=1883 RepID=A0ABD5JMV7_9ACTN|nr:MULTISPECIES: hypothetical protein [Streptomyces]MEE4588978.1 hypothetical protein [Streptomyces sp. DSM 41602]KUL44646.1 hypothetical protein ADL28_39685 [Streptomyces violaceusniger]QTI88169.1 hypothetical protein AS97_45945 [Streptomyces sp. AgN23]WJE00768.1 hypothetical protein QR300_35055 [Streptomyces antimycoticus]WTB09346.1 hypothetical protein OG546_37270 [Streptomyces antimycoticus]
MSAYRPRRPARAPSASDIAERDAFAALTAASTTSVRASAEAWRNGLTAFLTLVTTGVIIKGRDTAAGLPAPWLVAVTVLIGGGLLTAVIGLWLTLAAQAGTRPGAVTLHDIHRRYNSVAAYQVAVANQAARRLRIAQGVVAAALALLIGGVVTTWWAPPPSGGKTAYVRVNHQGKSSCGTLRSADGGRIRLRMPGRHELLTVPFGTVTNFKIVTSCR